MLGGTIPTLDDFERYAIGEMGVIPISANGKSKCRVWCMKSMLKLPNVRGIPLETKIFHQIPLDMIRKYDRSLPEESVEQYC
jgi:hypothetical protein